jgi:hypothetical protein
MGQINAEFRYNGNKMEYLITLPSNMEGDFVLSGETNKLNPGLNKFVFEK